MNKYLIELQYDGTDFVGWQEQPNGRTVQGEIESRLSTLLRQPTKIVGAGRTDTGVHASSMVAHVELPEELCHNLPEVIYRLNAFLPPDITILKLQEVAPDFHARFSAISRRYGYYITLYGDPFRRKYHTRVTTPLDFEQMNEAAKLLIGQHDFTAFAKRHSDVTHHLCTVTQAEWNKLGRGEWVFRIEANRFLRSMVRALVGTLIEVGSGRLTAKEFGEILHRAEEYHFNTAPATGLRLEGVSYPPDLLGTILYEIPNNI